MKLSFENEALAQLPNQPPFRVSVKSYHNGGGDALVRVQATDDPTTQHIPSTFVLTIDESGSMGSKAVRHDDSDGTSGLSQLDVVKHAARTIVATLEDQDRLGIVAFSDRARVVLPLTNMTKENKVIANRKIEDLRPLYSTNLYDGLNTALEMVRAESNAPPNANVMLLTDGMPNVRPPRGELETLRRYLDSHPEQRSVKISTFGFGYQLDSRLLFDLAREGGSIYAFIPDASFVGTIFINSISSLLAAASPRGATLKLEAKEGVTITGCSSGQKFTATSWGMEIEIPSILYGQSVDVFVQLGSRPVADPFSVTLEMLGLENPLEAQTETIDPLDPEDGIFRQAAVRSALVDFVRAAEAGKELAQRNGSDLQHAQQLLENTKLRVAELADSAGATPPGVAAIRQDIDGQITEAYSTLSFYKRWGSHYALSLAGAHTLQQCINFKDPGIQAYATGKFKAVRDASEEIFLKLEPPKPSRKATAPVASMRAYYSCSAPCFAKGAVTLSSGKVVQVADVRPGDVVESSRGFARVKCIVETPSKTGTENLVLLDGGVLVTPWHPVRAPGTDKWVFPCFLAEARPHPCDVVYSFVLEGDVSMRIGAFDGIALGHGIKGDEALEHDYLGTEKVVSDLSKMVGWSVGRVRLACNPAVRDEKTGRIVGFRQETENKENTSTPVALPPSAATVEAH